MVYSDYGASSQYSDRVAQMAGALQSDTAVDAASSARKYASQLADVSNYNDKIKTIVNPITDQFVRSAVESVHDTLGKGVEMGLNRAKGMAEKASKAIQEKAESTIGQIQNPLFDRTILDNSIRQQATDVGQDLQTRAGSITRDITGNTPTQGGDFSDAGRATRFLQGKEDIPLDNLGGGVEDAASKVEETSLDPIKDSSELGQDIGEDAGKAAEAGLKKGAEDAGLDAAAAGAEGAAATEGGLNPIADIAAVGLAVGSLFAEKKLEKKEPEEAPTAAPNVSQASLVRGI